MTLAGTFARAALLAAPLLLFTASPLAQPATAPRGFALLQAGLEGEEIAKDKEYAGGTRIKSARLGISFKVPDGFKASMLDAGNAMVLKGAKQYGVLVMRTGLTVADAKTMFAQEMDFSFLDENAWAERSGAHSVNGSTVTCDYEGDGVFGRAQATIGDKGAGWALCVLSTTAAKAKAAVSTVAESLAWAAPDSAKELDFWRGQLSGQSLKTEAGGETLTCALGKDGAYQMLYTHSEGEYREAGQWRVEIGPLYGFLVLVPKEGEAKTLYLMLDGNQIVVDGTKYTRTPIDGAARPPVVPDKTDKPEGKEAAPAESNDQGKVRKADADPNWRSDVKEVDKLDGEEMQINTIVVGEKRLKTDFLGVSFVVPAGIRGGTDGKTPVFIMRPDDQRGLGLLFMQTGLNTAAMAAATLHEDQDLNDLEKGVVLKPDGDAKIDGGKVTQDYTHETYTARAVILVGPSGNSIGVTFIGAKADKEKLRGYVDGIIKSVQLTKPKAEEKRGDLKKNLGGKVLHIYRYKAVNGASGNSSSWETKIWYHLGSDGSYYYQYKFESDHYVKGVDGGGNETHNGGAWGGNNREEKGTWRIEFNIAGILLVLKAENGAETVHQIRQEPGKVFLNNEEVSVGKSDKKN